MKRIFLLSTLIISSFGMINLQTVSAAPQAATSVSTAATAKKLVSRISQVVHLHGDQFSKVNDACVEYYTQVDALGKAGSADASSKIAGLKATRDAKIKGSLDADQVKAFASFKE